MLESMWLVLALFAHNLDVTYVTVALICLRLYFEHQVPRHKKLA